MSETFWAEISNIAYVVVGACMSYFLTSRRDTIAAKRAERRSTQQWARSETRRREQETREQRLHEEKTRAIHIREFLAHALMSRALMQKLLDQANERRRQNPYAVSAQREIPYLPVQERPTFFAAQAYAVALLGLSDLYPLAKDFYHATVQLEHYIETNIAVGSVNWEGQWRETFVLLEKKIGGLSGVSS